MTKRAKRTKLTQRERHRAAKKPNQTIILQNPVGHQFESFIVGNAQYCDKVVERNSGVGKRLVICGAGPSLVDEAANHCNDADELWGVNSALPWLVEHGYPATHGITVDQTPAMVNEWESLPDVEYLIPSTAHPYLVEALMDAGKDIRWFNNFVGIRRPPVEICECGHDKSEHDDACTRMNGMQRCECAAYDPHVMDYESWLYATLYPYTVRAGTGLNSVNRAIDVAAFMGFESIKVLGADCAMRFKREMPGELGTKEHLKWLREDVVMHADGGHALSSGATPVTLQGKIDGRMWLSKPDLIISAVFMAKAEQILGGRLQLIGDTLPNALKGKSDDFLARLPSLADSNGKPIPVAAMVAGLREYMAPM